MKKLLFLSLFIVNLAFGQSVTIIPTSNASTQFLQIQKNGIGLEQRSINGIVGVGTYVDNSGGAFIQTNSAHSLNFATNGGGRQMTLTTNGYFGIGSNASPTAQLDVMRGAAPDGTALFRGTTHASHFNYSSTEDTYIRGGINGANVIINDVAGLGNVGIGTTTPTKASLVVDKKIGAVHAIFGENTSGVAIESSYPGISFNGYYNGGRKPLSNGFVGGMAMNPNTGLISIYNTFASGTAGNNVTTQDVITMDNFGKVGIGNSSPQAKLHVTGNMRVESLAGTGKVQLYADDAGTVTGVLPLAFSAKSNISTTPIAHAIQTAFPFNTENYDLSNFYDNSTYEYIAPVNGIYHFDCAVTFGAVNNVASSSSAYALFLYVDGVSSGQSTQPMAVGGFRTLTLSQDIQLTPGQKVKILVSQSSGITINLIGNSAGSFFTGHLVTRL